MVVNDKIAKVQVWDTAGQERYLSITNAYYRGAEAILIVYDVTCKESFNSIPNWIEEVKKYTDKEILMAVGGNKSDLVNREVTKEDIDELTKKKNIKFFNIKNIYKLKIMESNDENLLKPDNAPDINQKKKKRLILFGSIIGALVIAIAIVIIVVVVKNKKNEEDSIEGSMLEITYEIFDEVRGEHNYQQPNLNVAIEFPDDDVNLEDYNKTGLDVYIDGIQVEVNKFYSFNTTGYHTVKYHFKGEGLRKGDIKYLFRRRIYITKIKFIKMAVKGIEDLQSMFYNCNNLRSIEGLEKIDTSNVDNMDYMFQCCYSLTSLNLNSFNTWKVTTMGSMFEFCNSLQSIKIDNFDTFFVKNFNSWFYDCTSLTSLDISKLDFYHSSDFADSFTNDHNLHLKLTQKQYDNIIYKGFNELEKQVAEVKIVKKN